jgi:hypothetical protein
MNHRARYPYRRAVRQAPMVRIDLEVPANILEALDSYARAAGVSRAEAARFALCCGPTIAEFLDRQGVPSADVVGP